MPVSTLWSSTIVVSLPALPLGGAGATTDDSDGTNGTAAATSTIVYVGSAVASNYVLRAIYGNAGAAGNSLGAAAGGVVVGTGSLSAGIAGGSSSATGGAGSAASPGAGYIGRGGGAGGGITTGDVPNIGGAGTSSGIPGAFGTPGGAINGSAVATYASLTTIPHPSLLYGASSFHGAAGSGGATNVSSANGGDGEYPGSGGGGSGATLNGSTPGRGGNGGPAAVWITFYAACPAIAFSDWVGAVAQWTYDTVSLLKALAVPVIDYASERILK